MKKLKTKVLRHITVFGCDVSELEDKLSTIDGDSIVTNNGTYTIKVGGYAYDWILSNVEDYYDDQCYIRNEKLIAHLFNSEMHDLKSNSGVVDSSLLNLVVNHVYKEGMVIPNNRYMIIAKLLNNIDTIIENNDELIADAMADVIINIVALSEIEMHPIEYAIKSKLKSLKK